MASAVTVKGGDTLGQRITAALATPPEASGTYKLYAQSHGKDTPDANIKSGAITVDYVYVAPTEPTITKMRQEDHQDDNMLSPWPFAAITIDGENLALGTGDRVTVGWTESGEEKSYDLTVSSSTASQIICNLSESAATAISDDTPETMELTVYIGEKSSALTVRYGGA